MEYQEHTCHKKHGHGSVLGYLILILVVLFILKNIGWEINLPGFGDFFPGVGQFFGNVGHWLGHMSVPVAILLIGVLLILGRRLVGALLLALAILMLWPQILSLPGVLAVFFFPVLLIIIGIIILIKLL